MVESTQVGKVVAEFDDIRNTKAKLFKLKVESIMAGCELMDASKDAKVWHELLP